MVGNLKEILTETLYQRLDNRPIKDLLTYTYVLKYVVKDMLEKGKLSARDQSLLWSLICDYDLLSYTDRKAIFTESAQEGDWEGTVKRMAELNYKRHKDNWVTQTTKLGFASPVRNVSGGITNDPVCLYLFSHWTEISVDAGSIKNLESVTTVVIMGEYIKTLGRNAIMNCPNLTTVFVPSTCRVEDEAIETPNVKVYYYNTEIKDAVTNLTDADAVQAELEDLKLKCEKYESDIVALQELDSIKEENTNLKQQVEELSKRASEEETANMKSEIESLNATVADLETRPTQEALQTVQESLAQTNKLLEELQDEKSTLEVKLNNLQKDMKTYEADADRVTALAGVDSSDDLNNTVQPLVEQYNIPADVADSVFAKAAIVTMARMVEEKAAPRHNLELKTLNEIMSADSSIKAASEIRDKGSVILANSGITGVDDFLACAYTYIMYKRYENQLQTSHEKCSELDSKVSDITAELAEAKSTITNLQSELAEAKRRDKSMSKLKKAEDDWAAKASAYEDRIYSLQGSADSLKAEMINLRDKETSYKAEILSEKNAAKKLEDEVKSLTQKLKDKEAEAKNYADQLEILAVDSAQSLELVKPYGIDSETQLQEFCSRFETTYSVELPGNIEADTLAMSCIVILSSLIKSLQESNTNKAALAGDYITLDGYDGLSSFLTTEAVRGLLQADGTSLADNAQVMIKLDSENNIANSLIANGTKSNVFGTMWPSTLRQIVDKLPAPEPDVATGVTQLDYVKAMSTLKVLIEEGKLPTQEVQAIQELIKKSKSANKHKDKILATMAKYGERDYDGTFEYVLSKIDAPLKKHFAGKEEELVALEIENVLSTKYGKLNRAQTRQSGGKTQTDVYTMLSTMYSNEGSAFLSNKYNELDSKVDKNLPESIRYTMMCELLQQEKPQVPNDSVATNRNAVISSIKAILKAYNLTDWDAIRREMIEEEKVNDTDEGKTNELLLWGIDAYLFKRQGFVLRDENIMLFKISDVKRKLEFVFEGRSLAEKKDILDSLLAKYAPTYRNESRLYQAVYTELSNMKGTGTV